MFSKKTHLAYLEELYGSVDVIQVLSSRLKVHRQEPGILASFHEDSAEIGQVAQPHRPRIALFASDNPIAETVQALNVLPHLVLEG